MNEFWVPGTFLRVFSPTVFSSYVIAHHSKLVLIFPIRLLILAEHGAAIRF